MSKYYGVIQMNHGHEYRWIFTEEMIYDKAKLEGNIDEISGEDIGWPINGSNSSSTFFVPLRSDAEIKDYLINGGYGPDSEDPCLVDLAEYLNTVDGDGEWCKSCTKEFLEKFNLNAKDLERGDIRYDMAKIMIATLKKVGYKNFHYCNPFYGRNKNMTFNELCELYGKVLNCEVEFYYTTNMIPLKKGDC